MKFKVITAHSDTELERKLNEWADAENKKPVEQSLKILSVNYAVTPTNKAISIRPDEYSVVIQYIPAR